MECILDFTLKMSGDLKTVYYETKFLQNSTQNLLEAAELLFKDYTQPIKYNKSLKDCSQQDDWESIRSNLDKYLDKMENALSDPDGSKKINKMQIDTNFPIDRLLQYLGSYNTQISQSGEFYDKFLVILDSYENYDQCSENIPSSFNKLKEDIKVTIDKFNTAYRLSELNGSKQKELLYGINEYD